MGLTLKRHLVNKHFKLTIGISVNMYGYLDQWSVQGATYPCAVTGLRAGIGWPL